jgi:hypothetical protein
MEDYKKAKQGSKIKNNKAEDNKHHENFDMKMKKTKNKN